MKKITLFSVIFLLSFIMLCACGKKNKDAAADNQIETNTADAAGDTVTETAEQTDGVGTEAETTMEFPGAKGIGIVCPEGYTGKVSADDDKCIELTPDSGTTDDYYEMKISLFEAEDKDEYLSKGQYKAEIFMKKLLLEKVTELYGENVYSYVGCNFTDGDTYWSITGYVYLDGEMAQPQTEEELTSAIELRYYGPDNYFVMTKVTALEENISEYFKASHEMIDTVTIPKEWNNCPKEVPDSKDVPDEKDRLKTDGSSKKLSVARAVCDETTEEDCSEPFYWVDKDKDIWLFNGISNEFIGFGSDVKVQNGSICSLSDNEWEYNGDYEYEYYDFYDPWEVLGLEDYYDMFDGYYEYYDGEAWDEEEDFDDEDWDEEDWDEEEDSDDEDWDDDASDDEEWEDDSDDEEWEDDSDDEEWDEDPYEDFTEDDSDEDDWEEE